MISSSSTCFAAFARGMVSVVVRAQDLELAVGLAGSASLLTVLLTEDIEAGLCM